MKEFERELEAYGNAIKERDKRREALMEEVVGVGITTKEDLNDYLLKSKINAKTEKLLSKFMPLMRGGK
tara:strand:+ start:4005 stop:4211 length:207 start_codon:yes stop_codon:yes gene_type:complete